MVDGDAAFWGALPVFRDNGYVDSGDHLLPLFAGAVPPTVLSAGDVYSHIEERLRAKEKRKRNGPRIVELPKKGPALRVRLSDAQVRGGRRMNLDP